AAGDVHPKHPTTRALSPDRGGRRYRARGAGAGVHREPARARLRARRSGRRTASHGGVRQRPPDPRPGTPERCRPHGRRSLRDSGALGRMSDRFFVATRKGVFTIERRKGRPRARWAITRAHFLADNASIVLPDRREGAVYVALGHGHFGVKLHRSQDGGRKWEPCATPVYPPKPEGIDDREPNSGKPIPWSTELVWALEAGHDTEPGTLWCGTLPGGLFRSRDRGSSWQLVESLWRHPKRREWFGGGAELPGLHSICVDPRDARHVTVGVSCGGVWMTRDGGTTWECRAKGM